MQRRAVRRRRSGVAGSKKQRCSTEKRQQGVAWARSGGAAPSLEEAGPRCGQVTVGVVQTLPTSLSSRGMWSINSVGGADATQELLLTEDAICPEFVLMEDRSTPAAFGTVQEVEPGSTS
jgi:hypothetical protein